MFEGVDRLAEQTAVLDASGTAGWVHSYETCGTGDGPGIRFVVFTQGCPLSCLYCHNPDARAFRTGQRVSVDELLKEIRRYRAYFRASGGGVTVSGGEPLMQPLFTAELFRRCHEQGINTALDTSGHAPLVVAAPVLEHTDLVLLDLKSSDPQTHRRVTGREQDKILAFAEHCAQIGKPIWVRFVLVPGVTDAPENIEGIARIAAGLGNVRRLDVLPFHKMGEYKWEKLGLKYELKDTPTPTAEQVQAVVNIFRRHGIDAR